MIHLHLAKDDVDEVEGLRNCKCGRDHSSEIDEAEANALEHFNQCLTLAPTYEPGYVRLAGFHTDAARPQQAADVYQRWLQQVPDDSGALLLLGQHYIDCDQPLKAREFAERARQLKPLDKEVGDLLWRSYVNSARQFVRQGQFDQARDELATADRLQPGRADDYDMLARKAVVEVKAGRPKAARALLEQAQDVLAEPTALWLVMAIEGICVGLPNKETWLYEKRWQDALKRRCQSETAGLLCHLLHDQLLAPRPYGSCDQHVQVLLKYLKRCSRVKWQVEDLRNVCKFLETAKEYVLLGKVVKRGVKAFPQSAFLHLSAALVGIASGSVLCGRHEVLEHLREAVQLGAASDDPRDKQIVEMAKKSETLFNQLPEHDYHDDYEVDDDLDDDDEEFDDFMDHLEGIPRSVVIRMIEGFCEDSGLDPEFVMAEIDRRQAATKSRRGK
jgi:tetratricopeptide (TPR) repeat protein